jgi:hypothetical protein
MVLNSGHPAFKMYMFSSRDLVLDMFEYLDLSTSMVKFYPEVSQSKVKKIQLPTGKRHQRYVYSCQGHARVLHGCSNF